MDISRGGQSILITLGFHKGLFGLFFSEVEYPREHCDEAEFSVSQLLFGL